MTDFSKKGPNPDTECGYGYLDTRCCTCSFLAFAKPKCHHLGGEGECNPVPKFPRGPLGALAKEGYLLEKSAEPKQYACTGFLYEGVVMTDWDPHGACEMYDRAERPLDPDAMSGLRIYPQELPF